MEIPQDIIKKDLDREIHQELMIYFFIAKRQATKRTDDPIQIIFAMPRLEEFVVPVIAYDMQSALEEAKQKNPDCVLLFNHDAQNQVMTVREFLGIVNLMEKANGMPQFAPQPPQEAAKDPQPSPDSSGMEKFKAGLIMAAHEYVEAGDREVLLKIIKKIKKQ